MDLDLLARVSNAYGVSGFEDDVQAVAQEVLSKCCDETSRDRLGNVIGVKRSQVAADNGDRPRRVVIAAHSDEIGMMVKHITPEGFIKFQPLGGLHAPSIVSQHVVIFGREQVRGVVAPHHGMPEAAPPLEGMFIDVGRPVDEVKALVSTGDVISFAQEFGQLNDKVVTGRNFDDRIGTYCLLEAMRGAPPSAVDVYAVSTVQEELGVRGMPVAAYDIQADIGLAIDGSICKGPHPNPHDPTCDVGEGAGVYVMDRLTMGDQKLVRFLVELCQEHGVAVQKNVGGGTDASAIQRTGRGAVATTVGAPVRYMHSTVQLCHVDDIEATISLLKLFIEHAHKLPVAGL